MYVMRIVGRFSVDLIEGAIHITVIIFAGVSLGVSVGGGEYAIALELSFSFLSFSSYTSSSFDMDPIPVIIAGETAEGIANASILI